MKPATRDILNTIGWQTVVEQYPSTAMNFARALAKEAGGPQSLEDRRQILEVERAIKNLSKAMANLSGRLVDDIERNAAGENWPDEQHQCVWEAYSACQSLLPHLEDRRMIAEKIIHKSGAGSISPRTGKVRKPRAPVADDTFYVIASTLAEVYLFGLRAYPRPAGTDADTGALNTRFNKALSAIIQSEGYKDPAPKTIVNMANAARRDLTLSKVKASIRENASTLFRWRATSFYAVATRSVLWCDTRDDEWSLWHRIMALETSD